MKCEYCGRQIRQGEVTHGIRYGTIDNSHEAFIPAKDSAITVICGPCGEKVYRLVYMSLRNMPNKPTYKTFNQFR